jgi:hypothetical protein
MNVRELIDRLSKCDPTAEVVTPAVYTGAEYLDVETVDKVKTGAFNGYKFGNRSEMCKPGLMVRVVRSAVCLSPR